MQHIGELTNTAANPCLRLSHRKFHALAEATSSGRLTDQATEGERLSRFHDQTVEVRQAKPEIMYLVLLEPHFGVAKLLEEARRVFLNLVRQPLLPEVSVRERSPVKRPCQPPFLSIDADG